MKGKHFGGILFCVALVFLLLPGLISAETAGGMDEAAIQKDLDEIQKQNEQILTEMPVMSKKVDGIRIRFRRRRNVPQH